MYQYLAGLLLLSTLSFAQGPAKTLQIEGQVAGVQEGVIYLQKFQDKKFVKIDSSAIKGGKFKFSPALQVPELYSLTLDEKKSPYYLFLDESDKVTVAFDTAAYYRNTQVQGSASQALYLAYEQMEDVKIDEFIRQHPRSLVSAYALYRHFSYRLSPQELESNVALLDASLHNTPYIQTVRELIVIGKRVQVGNPAIDFVMNDTEGNPLRLSDQYGGYLLVDFWAAWCGPCRRENPNVVKVYQKYKDRGFSVLGVSLDRSKESWLKAIEKDNLTWKHVSDLAYWDSAAAKLYGIRAIPANFLLDPNGVIVARNLRAEELEETIEKLLGQKETSQGSK
ncbi:TlpA disulfide reductase family protein [Rhabdobacter roseus]